MKWFLMYNSHTATICMFVLPHNHPWLLPANTKIHRCPVNNMRFSGILCLSCTLIQLNGTNAWIMSGLKALHKEKYSDSVASSHI